jgi:hypothetical protein
MLRKSVVRTGAGLAFLGLAALLALTGLGLCIWAIYLWLAVSMGPTGAAAITGAMTLCLAGGLTWIAIRLSR